MSLQEMPGMHSSAGIVSPSRAERAGRSALSAAWSPSDDLVMWGSTLWDLRVPKVRRTTPRPLPNKGLCTAIKWSCMWHSSNSVSFFSLLWIQAIHQFDQFTDLQTGCFHPRGLEIILNSEVWDMRTLRLLRCEVAGG